MIQNSEEFTRDFLISSLSVENLMIGSSELEVQQKFAGNFMMNVEFGSLSLQSVCLIDELVGLRLSSLQCLSHLVDGAIHGLDLTANRIERFLDDTKGCEKIFVDLE